MVKPHTYHWRVIYPPHLHTYITGESYTHSILIRCFSLLRLWKWRVRRWTLGRWLRKFSQPYRRMMSSPRLVCHYTCCAANCSVVGTQLSKIATILLTDGGCRTWLHKHLPEQAVRGSSDQHIAHRGRTAAIPGTASSRSCRFLLAKYRQRDARRPS